MTKVAPYFSFARAAWVPCVVLWDERTDELRRAEGPGDSKITGTQSRQAGS
jgi:hypothetical protein